VEDGSNAEVKRNVNCDLYEKKGKLCGQSEVMFSVIYVILLQNVVSVVCCDFSLKIYIFFCDVQST
jgi:hypothetical protein